ncbi:MAG: hypothetical protein V4692_11885 [Bdellovibrionota bacterium]
MNQVISKLSLVVLGAGLMVGCANAQREADKAMTTPSAESQTAANAAGAASVIEVNFDKGSFVLNEGSREALREMAAKAKANGKIDEFHVLAWADKDYPADTKAKATTAERDLANRRASSISTFIKNELAVSDVDTYNMTERPGTLSKLFNTDNARLKEAFEQAGVTGAAGKSITGKASRAVVMATLED